MQLYYSTTLKYQVKLGLFFKFAARKCKIYSPPDFRWISKTAYRPMAVTLGCFWQKAFTSSSVITMKAVESASDIAAVGART